MNQTSSIVGRPESFLLIRQDGVPNHAIVLRMTATSLSGERRLRGRMLVGEGFGGGVRRTGVGHHHYHHHHFSKGPKPNSETGTSSPCLLRAAALRSSRCVRSSLLACTRLFTVSSSTSSQPGTSRESCGGNTCTQVRTSSPTGRAPYTRTSTTHTDTAVHYTYIHTRMRIFVHL